MDPTEFSIFGCGSNAGVTAVEGIGDCMLGAEREEFERETEEETVELSSRFEWVDFIISSKDAFHSSSSLLFKSSVVFIFKLAKNTITFFSIN